MKTKVVVGYSTNRDEKFIERYNKKIIKNSGLKPKKGEIEICPLINEGEYSLTEAYNILWKSITEPESTVCVFIHHDIEFKSAGWGKNVLNIFNNSPVDILGVAGTQDLKSHGIWWCNEQNQMCPNNLWGKVWHTDGKKQWASNFSNQRKCKKIQPVVAIDGVFIAFNPATCIDFDTDFDGFHFYDVSFCIENTLHGKKIAVTETIQILHESGGQLSQKWEENRAKLAFIYERELPMKIKDEKEN